MKILDTNFVVSLFNQLDSNHQKAKDIFFAIDDKEKIRVPFIVAAELSISEDSKAYLYAAKEITAKFILNNEQDLEFISKIPFKTKRSFKANDCLIVSICKRMKADLLTFDTQLKRYSQTL